MTPAKKVYPDPLGLSLTIPNILTLGKEAKRRRYNRNVELLLGILVIVLVVVLLAWLVD